MLFPNFSLISLILQRFRLKNVHSKGAKNTQKFAHV